MTFLDCPAYLDAGRTVRCGLPAEVRCRFTVCSTVGPLESAMIRCPAGHSFNGPLESLTWDSSRPQAPGQAAVTPGARPGPHQAQLGGGRLALPGRGEPEREARRPNGAPAYYLGRPAGLYVTALRPRRPRRRHPGASWPVLQAG